MRKTIIVISILLFYIFSNCNVSFAKNNDENGYCISESNPEVYDFASNNFAIFSQANISKSNLTQIRLGTGITVFSKSNIEKVIFPVFENDKVIASFIVVKDNKVSGFFTQWYVDAINKLLQLSTKDNPMVLFEDDQGIYGGVGDIVISLTDGKVVSNDYAYLLQEKNVNVSFLRDYITYNDSAYYATFSQTVLSWTSNKVMGQYENLCTFYTTHNILWNQIYHYEWYNQMRNYIISIYGSTGLYQMNTSKVYSYLVNNGFTVGNYVATGSMTYNGVVSRINNGYYIFCNASNTSGGHAFTIVGYTSTGLTKYVDPYDDDILTSSGDSYTYPGYYGGTYDWDRGYISTIQEY